MSYEIAKSITIKNDKIVIDCASNNVFPKNWGKIEWGATRDDFRRLREYLDNGLLQPVDSANKYKWWFIDLEMGKMTFENEEARLDYFISRAKSRSNGKFVVYNTDTGMYMNRGHCCGRMCVWPKYDINSATQFNEYQARYLQIKYRNYFNAIKQVA